jgi:hypothetical protein
MFFVRDTESVLINIAVRACDAKMKKLSLKLAHFYRGACVRVCVYYVWIMCVCICKYMYVYIVCVYVYVTEPGSPTYCSLFSIRASFLSIVRCNKVDKAAVHCTVKYNNCTAVLAHHRFDSCCYRTYWQMPFITT